MSIDFFGRKLNTYRANLHTHSTLSDGEFTPDQVTILQDRDVFSLEIIELLPL